MKTFTLIKYDKFQRSSNVNGEIIMDKKGNANGFLEKIIEIGFDQNCFEVQYKLEDGILFGIRIGSFEKDDEQIEINKSIADTAMNLMPLIDLLKQRDKFSNPSQD